MLWKIFNWISFFFLFRDHFESKITNCIKKIASYSRIVEIVLKREFDAKKTVTENKEILLVLSNLCINFIKAQVSINLLNNKLLRSFFYKEKVYSIYLS